MNDIYQNTSSILMDILNMYIRMEYQEYHVSRHIYMYTIWLFNIAMENHHF